MFLKSLKPSFRTLCFHFELGLLPQPEFTSSIWLPDCGQGVWLRANFKENRVMGQMFYFSEVSKGAMSSALLKTSSYTFHDLCLAFERCYLLMSGSADTGTSS